MDFPDSTHDPLISAINKWSTILLPQTAAPCSLTHDVLSEHAVACLELKSQNEYISKTSGQHKADSDAPRPSLPFSWMDSNFKPRSLDLSGAFCSLDEVCERASPTDFLSSFLSAREDIKLFHDKAVYVLKILWHSPSPSPGLFSILVRILDLFRMMRSSFPSQLEGLGHSLESSLMFAITQAEPLQKRMKVNST